MENIIPFKGKVKFPITLDPGVWIFDDRRIDLNTYFTETREIEMSEEEKYTKEVSRFWDKEIREGAVLPPTIKSEKKYEKQKVLTGSFAVPFEPFLKNAEPDQEATQLIIETDSDEVVLPIENAPNLILAFSKDGKPLRDNGPVHILFTDGTNQNDPIKGVKAFRIE
ncbi:hypothetical protein JOC78_000182 [Bacillus ectoiniformans]|uniref:peptidyl-prolyl cis-trans isomerase n=1 Tax=Bacillus ectoiniformans TaxID=1494429 RepID=UPI00195AE864|nr:peptidyl-prolyl cis-trans isomerase [Bacillus ectoiniformans]MBM7647261.1 hypothetical protein [Bacillus ectoiniformans]